MFLDIIGESRHTSGVFVRASVARTWDESVTVIDSLASSYGHPLGVLKQLHGHRCLLKSKGTIAPMPGSAA